MGHGVSGQRLSPIVDGAEKAAVCYKPSMNAELKADLKRLGKLAYHRADLSGDLMRKYHALPAKCRRHPDYPRLARLSRWWLTPLTLWPVDVDGLGRLILDRIRLGRRLDDAARLLLDLLGDAPAEAAQQVVAQHEHSVQHGEYESLLHAPHKHDFKQSEIEHDPRLVEEWKAFKRVFDVKRYQDYKDIIRRRMVQERDFRPGFGFQWRTPEAKFCEAFDTFCHRWNLYGMCGDWPMVLKMTVNLTPFGTMIFIPAYWSFDPKRDFKWQVITELHRARGVARQGAKLGMNRLERQEEARRAKELMEQAKAQGLRGDKKTWWVMTKLGWDLRTDESRLRRLLKG